MKQKPGTMIKAIRSKPVFIDLAEFPFDDSNQFVFKILHCGKEAYDKEYEISRDYGRSFLFIYIAEGSVNLDRWEGTETLQKGDMAFISFKEYSKLWMPKNSYWSNMFLCIYGCLADDFYAKFKEDRATVFHHFDPKKMEEIIDAALCDYRNGVYDETKMSKQIYDFLLYLDKIHTPSPQNESLSSIFNYLKINFRKNVTLDQLSEMSGFSKFHLSRLLKEETGIGFSKYINKLRVAAAEKMLLETNLPNQEIAAKSGFDDVRSMYHWFKAILGTTPRKYKIENKVIC